jgi:FkbM family methyltransferase
VGSIQRRKANRQGDNYVSSRYSDHPLFVRAKTSDNLVFHQIFVDREYRCLDELSEVKTIIDAGANVGYSSAYLLSRYPEARSIAVEPDNSNYAALVRNLEPWGSRSKAVRGALWSEVTTLDFRNETLSEGSEWGRQVQPTASGDVSAFDVPTLMREHDMDTVDLLKIDIEGAEEAVFSASDLSWLDRVRNIVIELHGKQCSDAFYKAVAGRGYRISECDELTVALGV